MPMRTNLKQQLMKEQVMQEDQRHGNNQHFFPASAPAAGFAYHQPSQSIPVIPVNSRPPPAAVPVQMLQIESKLDNPTKYHLQEQQRSLIRSWSSHADGDLVVQSVPGGGGGQQAAVPGGTPTHAISSSVPGQSPDSPLSAGQASVSTTYSEVPSSTLMGDAYNLSPPSSSCPTDLVIKQEPLELSDGQIRAIQKDRQKKDNHNKIERKRRYNINDRIMELGRLLPRPSDPLNKGSILKASVDYMRELKQEVNRLKEVEQKHKQTEQLNRKMTLMLQQLTVQAQDAGVNVPPVSMDLLVAPPLSPAQPQIKSESREQMAPPCVNDVDMDDIYMQDVMSEAPSTFMAAAVAVASPAAMLSPESQVMSPLDMEFGMGVLDEFNFQL
ncbi:PREDICTED: transcription factor E3-like isoform X2 [Priapulus caudatus]|nr:PREDICTED: transcription factor E3-like isoform X2 [Priapulus caudatus]